MNDKIIFTTVQSFDETRTLAQTTHGETLTTAQTIDGETLTTAQTTHGDRPPYQCYPICGFGSSNTEQNDIWSPYLHFVVGLAPCRLLGKPCSLCLL